ncbi:MAG: hypothetical protein JWM95_5354 [Gemmatimonadetes bacterium]|nr:hypothetical protein [Gemmatimonadota bacterium]
MIAPVRTVLLALLLAPAARLGAQKAAASAQVGTQVPQVGAAIICDQHDGPVASASAVCGPMQVKGGQAGAQATADLLARTTSVTVGMIDKGTPGLTAAASAQSRITGKIDVTGTADAGDYLVLHFLASLDYEFGGRPADVFTALVTAAHGEGDAGASFFSDVHYGNHAGAFTSNGAHRAQGGFDLLLAFDNFTGSYKYTYGAGIEMAIDDAQTAVGYVQFGLHLAGIDAFDVDNRYLASVVFNESGAESLALPADEVQESTAPEPATFVLFATGLAAVAATARRRRRAFRLQRRLHLRNQRAN